MNRAVLLVLAHLTLAGCGKKSGANHHPLPTPGKECTSSVDCTEGDQTWCMKIGDAGTGKCYPPPMEGRALTVDGASHVAPLRSDAELGSEADVTRLHAAAQEEHASIAAFARTITELMAEGAPLWLLSETQQALADEVLHTERTLDLIAQLTGERPALGPLPAAVAPIERSAEDFFRDVLRGGAIGETLAAARAELRLCQATNAALRAHDEMLVVDESRHAALAFKTLRWLLERRPQLRAIADEELSALDRETQRLVRPLFETAFV